MLSNLLISTRALSIGTLWKIRQKIRQRENGREKGGGGGGLEAICADDGAQRYLRGYPNIKHDLEH